MGRKAATTKADSNEEVETDSKPVAKRGRKAAAAKEEEKEVSAEEAQEEKTLPKRVRKAPKKLAEEDEVAVSSPVKPRGRAAAKKAASKTKTDLEDMSNLGKKKRRPSTPGKRKIEEVEESSEVVEPAKKTRARRK